ncbi:MAG: hypothetical protein ACI85F_000592 [Bacteroidia bacterium]|jgi:hypothetical protein
MRASVRLWVDSLFIYLFFGSFSSRKNEHKPIVRLIKSNELERMLQRLKQRFSMTVIGL